MFVGAIDEFQRDGILNTSIKTEDEGNHLKVTVEPTDAVYLFNLGMKYHKLLEPAIQPAIG